MLCQVIIANPDGARVRSRPSTAASQTGALAFAQPANVVELQRGPDDGRAWYFLRAQVDTVEVQGWVREDSIRPQAGQTCPALP